MKRACAAHEGVVEQMVARKGHSLEVTGSSPVYAPRKGVTLVTPFFVVYQIIKALEVDGEHIKIGCIFTGNLPVFPDFYRYFHL